MVVTNSTPPSTPGLTWLIDPVSMEEFLSSHWDNRPLTIARNRLDYYKNSLPTLDEVDDLITTTVFGSQAHEGYLVRTAPDGRSTRLPLRLTTHGHPDIHYIYRCYTEGYTVVLDHIEARSSTVSALCRMIEADLNHRVGANLYLTPRNAQGARAHTDSHDVIIVQLHGTKTWRIASNRSTTTGGRQSSITIEDGEITTLSAGDALYLPRGYAHEGSTDSSSSLHLTIGFNTLTWADILIEALRLAATESQELQSTIPVKFTKRPFSDSEVSFAEKMLGNIASSSSLEKARISLGSKMSKRLSATSGHFRSLDIIDTLTMSSPVEHSTFGFSQIRPANGRLILEYPGNYVSVPQHLDIALEYVTETKIFTASSIPGNLRDEQKLEFVKRLIKEGFLTSPEIERD